MSDTFISASLRQRVSRQARYRCGYCLTQEKIVGAPMEIDHIIPQALGGETVEANLWLACSLCNDYKGSRIAALDTRSGEIVRLFDPRHQAWHEHFAWSENGEYILGLTPTGRATVNGLRLNRPSLVFARRL